MGAFTVTPDLQVLLSQFNERTEFRDIEGNVIGIFTPPAVAEAELYERVKRMIDPEEIKLRKQGGGAVPFEEVLQRLKSTETSE